MKKVFKVIGIVFLGFIIFIIIFVWSDLKEQKEVRKMVIKDVNINNLSNGSYEGEYNNYRWSNKVRVTINNHKITKINFIEDKMAGLEKTRQAVADEVIEKQSLKVDTVSGATISTKAYLKSIEDALNQ